jgi:hypothetical protein
MTDEINAALRYDFRGEVNIYFQTEHVRRF